MKPSQALKKYGSDKVIEHTYGQFYDNLFSQYEETMNILEVGVLHGQSAMAWREAFPKSKITCIDIRDVPTWNPYEWRVEFIIADVKKIKLEEQYDIIIDDSSHDLLESIYEVINFTPHLTDKGCLIIEDVQIPETYLSAYKAVLPDGFKIETIDFRRVKGRHDDYIVKISRK